MMKSENNEEQRSKIIDDFNRLKQQCYYISQPKKKEKALRLIEEIINLWVEK